MLIQTNTLNLNLSCAIVALCDEIIWNNKQLDAEDYILIEDRVYLTTVNLKFNKLVFDNLMKVVVKSEFDTELQSKIAQCELILKEI